MEYRIGAEGIAHIQQWMDANYPGQIEMTYPWVITDLVGIFTGGVATSVVDGVYDVIYHRLMLLEIAPGARIPIDALARELNVSQTPVREALNRLEREGLVCKEHLIGYSAAPQWTREQFQDLFT